jgi:hypothetical protein
MRSGYDNHPVLVVVGADRRTQSMVRFQAWAAARLASRAMHSPFKMGSVMQTIEEQLIEDISYQLAKCLRQNGLGLYAAMRIMGYVTVALAESVDLEGAAERDT